MKILSSAILSQQSTVPTPSASDNSTKIANTEFVTTAIGNHASSYASHVLYGVNTSANDSYTITVPNLTSYNDIVGIPIVFKATIANTDACSLNINSLGAKNIVRGTGTTLVTGDIPANKYVMLIYNGTSFELVSQGADVVQLTATQTLTNKTLTTPTLTTPRITNGGSINDNNGNEQIKFVTTTSAVNEITVTNAATGTSPSISATGNDANIGLNLASKGTGVVSVNGTEVVTVNTTATSSKNGAMSSTDKSKLDGISANANNYSHPTGDGNLHVPATGTTNNGKFLMAGSTAGSMSWAEIPNSGIIGVDIGTGTKAIKLNSGLEASGANALAQGLNTIASGSSSHAEGVESIVGSSITSATFNPSTNVVSYTPDINKINGVAYDHNKWNVSDSVILAYLDNTSKYFTFTTTITAKSAKGSNSSSHTITLSSAPANYTMFVALVNKSDQSISGGHAQGNRTKAIGANSHSEGDDTLASGASSHAEGVNSKALLFGSHAEGYSTEARGLYAHAEGALTIAEGEGSHAEGSGSYALGFYSHAEGSHTQANGISSHSEGEYTNAQGFASHAEGFEAVATGNVSHAEGSSTIAGGVNSHAEGSGSYAGGDNSHAEGQNTEATGINSHAEGNVTKAIGSNSHSQNKGTIAQGESQTAIGKYNVAQGNPGISNSSDYAFIVGNGSSDASRSNAFAVKWDGTIDFAEQDAKPLTLNNGVKVYDIPAKSRFRSLKMAGRTLVNLIGSEGGFERATPVTTDASNNTWQLVGNYSGHGSAVETTASDSGKQSYKLFRGGAASSIGIARTMTNLQAGKYYVALGMFSALTPSVARFGIGSGDGAYQGGVTSLPTTDFQKFKLASFRFVGNTNTRLQVNGTDTMIFVDSIRVYEVTSAEWNAFNGLTDAQKIALYPYVDNTKHVNAVYAISSGENLLPPYTEWTHTTTSSLVKEPYDLAISSTGTPNTVWVEVPVVPSQSYTISCTLGIDASHRIRVRRDSAGGTNLLNISTGTGTFTVPSDVDKVYVCFEVNASGNFSYKNPMLVIGSTSQPFKPQNKSYLFLPDVQAKSNADGSIADQVYMLDNQVRAVRRFKEIVLNGSLPFVYDTSATGYKGIKLPVANSVMESAIVVKHDGKILKPIPNIDPWSGSDQQSISISNLYLSIATSDSGWGDSYTPTQAEIQAYFWGWRMYLDGQQYSTPYNGSGTRGWFAINTLTGGLGNHSTLTRPSGPSPYYDYGMGYYAPYRLMYQLSQSVDEPVVSEGSLELFKGLNQIEVGTGVVVREQAKPSDHSVAGWKVINHLHVMSSLFKNRADIVLGIHRDGRDDKKWTKYRITTSTDINGYGFAQITTSEFSQESSYSVTYIALDRHSLGIAPQAMQGEYLNNIKEAVDDAVSSIIDLQRDVDVIRNTKSEIQQPQWIAPTLLNGWQNNGGSSSPVGYYKEGSYVNLRGAIINGVTTAYTTVFILPEGYRPKTQLIMGGVTNNGTTAYTTYRLDITTDGRVTVTSAFPNYVGFDGIRFRVD